MKKCSIIYTNPRGNQSLHVLQCTSVILCTLCHARTYPAATQKRCGSFMFISNTMHVYPNYPNYPKGCGSFMFISSAMHVYPNYPNYPKHPNYQNSCNLDTSAWWH